MALNCAQSGRASGSRMLELTLLLAAGAVMLLRFAAEDVGKPGARQEAGALRGDAAP